MLQLKGIKKSYTTGDFTQVALNNVSLNFRKSEFVAILGQSGSGKTTCLNIIGGLDKYDNGDLIINGKSTKEFKDSDWDAYRNNSIGYIFQSYNLITHLSIVDNVEMGMTLSGVSANEKHKKALEVLEKVGLKEHIHKKPNQLSGGQMQRVAIARALANDPDIILADEPTGALDTTTSEQIMELIKEIADDKLVIMVTHNPELAESYADRIVEFKDGNIVSDSNPYKNVKVEKEYKLKKTSMSFFTALKLSAKNISTKKWRTALTAFASSIGLIGIALILSLSSGFQIQIDKFQRDALSEFPITVSQTAMNTDEESMEEMRGEMTNSKKETISIEDSDKVFLYDPAKSALTHTNIITEDYVKYINNADPKILSSVGYLRTTGMNVLRDKDGKISPISLSSSMSTGNSQSQTMAPPTMSAMGLSTYPEPLDNSTEPYLKKNYDLLFGEYPQDETGLVLVLDSKNRVNFAALKNLGFNTDNVEDINFKDIVGTEFKLITNNDFYTKTQMNTFLPGTDYTSMYNSKNSVTLKISGVVRLKEDVPYGIVSSGVAYSDKLVQRVLDSSKDSEIVKAQKQVDYNIINMEKFDSKGKTNFLAYLGGESIPYTIYLYPTDFDSKDAVLNYLDDYNQGKSKDDTIVYTDLASSMTEMTGGIMNAITLVLIAFAGISLVVSLIMIGIITYISVLERTKEIGVLRALGARKKDITRVFNAETFIIGASSGILSIVITYLLTIPVNKIIENLTDLANVAKLNPLHAIGLIIISVALTLLGGLLPARMAAKKDPVEALRTE
ncbi:ATP-binding cassette domain-containing protein [Clostridium sp. SHJSY1]|uniref:ABC transporter ATP-binding protein/permease n=1 Tax=Clostridium sp. SHJSY1 TaxID=2942483 RepID=UPI0028743286|nr:ATP-binding cassette domain-containing protein [Clostridium sp. SHJSY1]MDS0525233.1 ATP-binding cassette domain-containing protein [Clostridium sp. SHJSY1]